MKIGQHNFTVLFFEIHFSSGVNSPDCNGILVFPTAVETDKAWRAIKKIDPTKLPTGRKDWHMLIKPYNGRLVSVAPVTQPWNP